MITNHDLFLLYFIDPCGVNGWDVKMNYPILQRIPFSYFFSFFSFFFAQMYLRWNTVICIGLDTTFHMESSLSDYFNKITCPTYLLTVLKDCLRCGLGFVCNASC